MGDIMRIGLPEAARPKPVILVSGRVLDAKTKQPVVAQIHYELLPEGKDIGVARSGPTTGEYKITLPSGGRYAFRAEAPGYIAVNDNLDITTLKEYRELTRDLYLVPIEVGQTVRLNNIFFDFAKTILRDESFPELNRMADLLKSNPTMEIEIAGHTDNVGTDESNLALSRNRAIAVSDYLASKGINRSRMKVQGYGMSKPLATNDTEEGRQQNRRVEVKILKR
jgi:outer membrane protein OmpA-like peptidoglycan-associated protein